MLNMIMVSEVYTPESCIKRESFKYDTIKHKCIQIRKLFSYLKLF